LIALGAALAVALGPFWGIDQILPRCVSGGLPAMLIVAAAAFGPRLSASWIVTPLVVLATPPTAFISRIPSPSGQCAISGWRSTAARCRFRFS
jgi:predicted permease